MAMFKHHLISAHFQTRREWFGAWDSYGSMVNLVPNGPMAEKWHQGHGSRGIVDQGYGAYPLEMHGSWDAHGYCMNRGCGLPALPGPQGMQQGLKMLSRCGSNQAALMTSKFVPCTSTLNSQPETQTRFVTKVIIMIIMQAKHADVFMFSLETMWRRRGGPIYGPIIGQRWSTILGAALVIFGTLAGMRPNRK